MIEVMNLNRCNVILDLMKLPFALCLGIQYSVVRPTPSYTNQPKEYKKPVKYSRAQKGNKNSWTDSSMVDMAAGSLGAEATANLQGSHVLVRVAQGSSPPPPPSDP